MAQKNKNSIFIILILAAVLFYIFSGGSVGISLDFGEDALVISASDYDWTIAYDQIESLGLTELPDAGTLVEGFDKRTLRCGTWKNGVWGEYILCIDTRNDTGVIVTMKNGDIYVLNYENRESTQQLHKMFTELLESKKRSSDLP